MAVKVSVKNTFLSVECASGFDVGSKRRSRSEEVWPKAELNSRSLLAMHLEGLETILCMDVVHSHQEKLLQPTSEDVQVIQSECLPLLKGFPKSRPLGKIGSIMSMSTMAPEDDDASTPLSRSFGSSDSLSSLASSKKHASFNSLSSLAWCDEEDDTSGEGGLTGSCRAESRRQMCAPQDSKHNLVPKKVNLAASFVKTRKEGQAITTVMIRNIPNRISQRELIGELEHVGLGGCFDFLYIPLDLGTMSNVGYAFVNFTHPASAVKCMELLPRHPFMRQRTAGKGVVVCAAHMQGLELNLRHYEKSAVNTSRLRQRRPVVFNVLKTVSLADAI